MSKIKILTVLFPMPQLLLSEYTASYSCILIARFRKKKGMQDKGCYLLMRILFILYLNSDSEEWAKQSELLESDIKLTMEFEESNFSLIPKAILHTAREERWFWKFVAISIHLVYQLEDIYRCEMEVSQKIYKNISPSPPMQDYFLWRAGSGNAGVRRCDFDSKTHYHKMRRWLTCIQCY